MDVRKPLSFEKIKFLYDSLKSDIKDLNSKIDFIAEEVKDTIKNLSDEDKERLKNGKYIENLNKYGRIINKAYLEKNERGENKDRFADLHTEFLKQKNQNLTAYKREVPKDLKNLENLTEEQWNEKTDLDKIEIEKHIRNQSYFVAEAMLPAINITKYEKNQNKKLGKVERRYNEKVYEEKDKAMTKFLVKLAEANEMLKPEEKHFAGVDEDKALCTLNMSVHFGSDENLEEIFMEANEILKREEYPTEIDEIQDVFGYDLPHFNKDKGLISHQYIKGIDERIAEFIHKVLRVKKDENGRIHYEVDKEKLELYVNFLHQDLTEREIFHIVNEINYISTYQIFGEERIFDLDEMLLKREELEGKNTIKNSAEYVRKLLEKEEDTEDRGRLIKKLLNMFLQERIITSDYKTILDLSLLKEYKNILVQAGVELDEIEECSKGLEEGLIKIIWNDKDEVKRILEQENICLRKRPGELFMLDNLMETLKRSYGFSKKRERMELINLNAKELNRSLINRKGRFNRNNFATICSWGTRDSVKSAVKIANSRNIDIKEYIKEDDYQK